MSLNFKKRISVPGGNPSNFFPNVHSRIPDVRNSLFCSRFLWQEPGLKVVKFDLCLDHQSFSRQWPIIASGDMAVLRYGCVYMRDSVQ